MENTAFFEPKSWWKNGIYWLLKSSCFGLFGNGKYGLFLRQKVNEKMIFTDYWNVLVLNFSEKENAVFFEAKSWWKDDIYQLMKSSCFELFRDGKCGRFLRKKVTGKMIFTDYWKVLVLSFSVMGIRSFFQPKSWCKGNICLVFFSFPWYSRTWEMQFFVQCINWSWIKNLINIWIC